MKNPLNGLNHLISTTTRVGSLAFDLMRCLRCSMCQEGRLNNYHVRAIYSGGGIQSVEVDGPNVDNEDDCELRLISMNITRFAVYGYAPEGMFVCGDELPYTVALVIAFVLNRFYPDDSIVGSYLNVSLDVSDDKAPLYSFGALYRYAPVRVFVQVLTLTIGADCDNNYSSSVKAAYTA